MRRRGPIPIHGRALKPSKLAHAQNRTARAVWPHFVRHNSFLLADPVGAGKSYVALSLALGMWRSAPPRRTPFRLLVLAATTELSDSWLQKLVGKSQPRRGIGTLAQQPGAGSFSQIYLDRTLRNPHCDTVVYQLRRRWDAEQLREELSLADDEGDLEKRNLRPRKATDAGRIEVLVTSPRWALIHLTRAKRKAGRAWASWLKHADAVIADEVFGAKNPWSIYGKLLRPWQQERSPRHWRGGRPHLIGLSATLLSRDLSDAREIFDIAIRWRRRSKARQRLLDDINSRLPKFSRALRSGLRETSGPEMLRWLKDYDVQRKGLEDLLANVITRTSLRKNRQHLFWALGLRSPDPEPAHRTSEFPINGSLEKVLENLQSKYGRSPGASDSLAWFIDEWRRRNIGMPTTALKSWTAFTESATGAPPRRAMNPKLASLEAWLRNTYREREKEWLDRSLAPSPRFKILVYVQHLPTAAALNPRARNGSLGRNIQRMVGRLMLGTCRQVAKRNPDLFKNGELERPSPPIHEALQSQGWTISRLMDSERTLLLAACINAHKGRTNRERVARFEFTLRGTAVDRRLELFRTLLRRQLALREHVLNALGRDDLLDYEADQRKAGRKLNPLPSVALLDPEVVGLPPRQRGNLLSAFTQVLGAEARVLMFASDGSASELIKRLAATLLKAIKANETWQRSIEEFEPNRGGFAFLRRRSEGRHWTPHELAVQTGEDSGSRTFVMERFRSPGNPFVLVLTNVGTVGVDLHPFCWDIAHYTPDWTPHMAEQKTGRIDRPRNQQAQRQLHIAKDTSRIAVHHLVWPFTYDERILSRLNLRAQLAERLLGSKYQAAIETDSSEDVGLVAARFRAINLAAL